MRKLVPVAGSSRDGYGHVFSVEVAGGRIRTSSVPILAADGSLVGEVTRDGTAYWDPEIRLGVRTARVEVRRALAVSGRLSASVDERGMVLAFIAEESRGISTRAMRAASSTKARVRAGDEIEMFNRP
jgi:hypothetical protein